MKSELKKRNIPFSPPDITELEINEVVEALRSGWITTGPRTKELERRLREKDLLNKEKSQENKVVFFDSSNNIDKEKRFFEVLNC